MSETAPTELISFYSGRVRKRPLSLVLLTLSTNVKSRWAAAPHSIIRSKPMISKLNVEDFLSHLNESIDLLVICNPNNLTSSSIPRSDMRHILDVCKQYDIYVMVDETYVEFADNMAELTAVPLTNYYNNIVILRGTSKFFAAPGLRLGYAVTGNRDLIKSINTRKNPWDNHLSCCHRR